MDSATDATINEFIQKVKIVLPDSSIYLYGSYAAGSHHDNSDIDIAVIVDTLDSDFLETSAQLFAFTWSINTSIEPKLIVKKNNESGFHEYVIANGKKIA